MADRVGRKINKGSSVNRPTVRKTELVTKEGKVLKKGCFLTLGFALANALSSCYYKMTTALNTNELLIYLCGIPLYEGIEESAVFLRHHRHRNDRSGLAQVLIQVPMQVLDQVVTKLWHFH